ncbi:MAG: hypothetical protein ABIG92_05210 [Candidatus Omnitrophota bacterium]
MPKDNAKIIKISGLSLVLREKDKIIPSTFNRFFYKKQNIPDNSWHLESIDQGIKRPKDIILPETLDVRKLLKPQSYFNKNTFINIKAKRIKHLYSDKYEKNNKYYDTKLFSFCYSQMLASENGLLLHGSAVIKGNSAYLFFAPSGGGKTTAAKLSRRSKVLGDDVVALKKCGRSYYVYSTPWNHKDFTRNSSISAKVDKVFFLKKSKNISFKPIKKEDAFIKLLTQQIHFFIYTKRPILDKLFFTASGFIKNTETYEMKFRKDKSFWNKLNKEVLR